MTYAISTAIILLASALIALCYLSYQNHVEIELLKRNGHRRVYFCRPSNRGHVDYGFLRGLAEFFFLILMLGAVLGWLAHSTPQ